MVQDNHGLMSQEITRQYGGKLPFLFKVLSIRKALSIQAHPNKKLAEQLHGKDPKNYPGIGLIFIIPVSSDSSAEYRRQSQTRDDHCRDPI